MPLRRGTLGAAQGLASPSLARALFADIYLFIDFVKMKIAPNVPREIVGLPWGWLGAGLGLVLKK